MTGVDELNIIKDISNFKMVLYDNAMWITHYIKILMCTSECVRLKVKNNILTIEGVNISIVLLEKNELILNGKFNNIFLEKPYKAEEKNAKKIWLFAKI